MKLLLDLKIYVFSLRLDFDFGSQKLVHKPNSATKQTKNYNNERENERKWTQWATIHKREPEKNMNRWRSPRSNEWSAFFKIHYCAYHYYRHYHFAFLAFVLLLLGLRLELGLSPCISSRRGHEKRQSEITISATIINFDITFIKFLFHWQFYFRVKLADFGKRATFWISCKKAEAEHVN